MTSQVMKRLFSILCLIVVDNSINREVVLEKLLRDNQSGSHKEYGKILLRTRRQKIDLATTTTNQINSFALTFHSRNYRFCS